MHLNLTFSVSVHVKTIRDKGDFQKSWECLSFAQTKTSRFPKRVFFHQNSTQSGNFFASTLRSCHSACSHLLIPGAGLSNCLPTYIYISPNIHLYFIFLQLFTLYFTKHTFYLRQPCLSVCLQDTVWCFKPILVVPQKCILSFNIKNQWRFSLQHSCLSASQ